MEDKIIQGRTLLQWRQQYPLLHPLMKMEEVFWFNPYYTNFDKAIKKINIKEEDVKEAEERLNRFAPYLQEAFPETRKNNGIIESPLAKIGNMKKSIQDKYSIDALGNLLLKCDNALPIAGSIKARGGIYEVLKHAEDLAMRNNMLSREDDYSIISSDRFKSFYANYSIAVGSTGNLGLSIGMISAKLGFKVTIHMSSDAKQWKKDLLRSKGVTVIEYDSDYSKAVEEGRKQSLQDPNSYFIDDENSINLFLGYAVAAYRMKKQLDEMMIKVDAKHPLCVYLPCGVGGGPGGVAFGLKLLYQDNVHCFFAEPTHSPCMLLGLMTGLQDKIAVQDFEIDNITDADGLAVGRPSGFVGETLKELLAGIYTVEDDQLYSLLKALADTEDIYLEPSALAGMYGPIQLSNTGLKGQNLLHSEIHDIIENATHIVWATGGSLVPEEEMRKYYHKDKDR